MQPSKTQNKVRWRGWDFTSVKVDFSKDVGSYHSTTRKGERERERGRGEKKKVIF